MTISTTSNTVIAQGNGLTTFFDFTFPVPLASELSVYFTDLNGTITLLSPSSYSTTGIGTANGGSVTYPLSGSPIPSGTSLTIQRVVPYQQLTDLVNQSGYYPNVVENALDYLTMQTQQLAQLSQLALKVPLSSTPANLTLPSAITRANTVVGFDSNGNAIVLPTPASVGAGDLRTDIFASGSGFTPGVSTSVTLSRAPGSVTNVQVHFDALFQGPDQILSVIGNILTFTAPIPTGVSRVYVTTGTSLSQVSNLTVAVNVRDYGAKGDGVTNDTSAFLTAFTKGSAIQVPAGTYVLDQITIPSGIKSLVALGLVTLIPSSNVPNGATFATWITASSLVGGLISGFRLQAPSATYPSLTCLFLSGCTMTNVVGNTIAGAGYTGISSALGTNNKIVGNSVTDWVGNGIVISGSSFVTLDAGTETYGNFSQGNGTSSIAHCISHQFAVDFDCHDNRCLQAGTFGIAAYECAGGKIHDNLCYNTTHEAINTEDSTHTEIRNNTCRWDSGGPSIDFGISVFGNAANCIFIDVIGNKVINSGSSGICLTGSASFGVQNSMVHNNAVINCNAKRASVAGGTDNLAAILISASPTQGNSIKGNFVYDNIGVLTYGIGEVNFGLGSPTSQEITGNRVFSTIGFLGQAIIRTNTFTTLMGNSPDLAGLQPYTPVVSSSAGAITSYTSNGGYVQFGRTVLWVAQVNITNNGTGSGQLNVTGPFAGVASAIGAGNVSGTNVTTGKAISGPIPSGGSSAVVTNYDGTYPVATGNTINIFGIEMIA